MLRLGDKLEQGASCLINIVLWTVIIVHGISIIFEDIRHLILISYLFISLQSAGQDSIGGIFNYHVGFNLGYPAAKEGYSFFILGAGLDLSMTSKTIKKLKPTLSLSMSGFPEMVWFGNEEDAKALGLFSFLAGVKYQPGKIFRYTLSTGVVNNNYEGGLDAALKPGMELSTAKDKFLFQISHLAILNSEVLNSYTSMGVMLRLNRE